MSVIEEQELGLLFTSGDTLTAAIANSRWTDSAAFSELHLSCEQLGLTAEEETSVKDIVFPDDLHFTVPVNLRDSKKAYLTIMEDTDTDDADMLPPWETLLENIPATSTQEDGDAAETDEKLATTESQSLVKSRDDI